MNQKILHIIKAFAALPPEQLVEVTEAFANLDKENLNQLSELLSAVHRVFVLSRGFEDGAATQAQPVKNKAAEKKASSKKSFAKKKKTAKKAPPRKKVRLSTTEQIKAITDLLEKKRAVNQSTGLLMREIADELKWPMASARKAVSAKGSPVRFEGNTRSRRYFVPPAGERGYLETVQS